MHIRRSTALKTKKAAALLCAAAIVINTVSGGLIGTLNSILGENNVSAAETISLGEPQVHAQVPECEFIGQLYTGEKAIGRLPEQVTYRTSAPKRISLTDFRQQLGSGYDFDLARAREKKNEGFLITLGSAQELYTLSMIANRSGDISPEEQDFYLSANYVLGSHIEYYEMSSQRKYFLPIGSDSLPFKGSFDGQGFEIRDLYFDPNGMDAGVTIGTAGFFGVIDSSAEIHDFGLIHPFLRCLSPTAVVGMIAGRNRGNVHDVYVVADEYDHTEIMNTIETANANATCGLIANNLSGAVLRDSYFAGRLSPADREGLIDPVCAVNNGTIENCYYDSEIYQCTGAEPFPVEALAGKTGLSNASLKKVGIASDGMTNTRFHALRAAQAGTSVNDESPANCWRYPKLCAPEGSGTDDDPFVIKTPAQLISLPESYEYYSANGYSFTLGCCIDMDEVSPFAYKPMLHYDFITNSCENGTANKTEYRSTDNSSYPFRGKLFAGTAENDDNCCMEHIDLGENALDGLSTNHT